MFGESRILFYQYRLEISLSLHQHGDKLVNRIEIDSIGHAPPGLKARFAGPLLIADNDKLVT